MKTARSSGKCIRSCLQLIASAGILFFATGCGNPGAAVPAAVKPLPEIRVAFDSFINVNYGKRRSLHGWPTTQTAIETTLKLWYDQVETRQTVVDGTPADLKQFLYALPDSRQCDISVVYLGSIQDAAAGWEFMNGQIVNWRDILADALPPAHPCRIVILDTCHAASVLNIAAWSRSFDAEMLLASGAAEKTYQFSPSALSPIDVQKHLPPAWAWAQAHLPPNWKKHISFLGLIWIETTAKTSFPPADKTGWGLFFDDCAQNACVFGNTISRRWGSTVQTFSCTSN